MRKITKGFLKDKRACKDGYEWWIKNCEGLDNVSQIQKLADHRFDWANWLIVRIMTYKQYVSYAVYAAEQVIDIYEKKCSNDDRPRKAIEAAKKCIKAPTKKNKATADAAATAAYAADVATADAAADAAIYATAIYAADAAATAAYAIYAATTAAAAAAAAADAAAAIYTTAIYAATTAAAAAAYATDAAAATYATDAAAVTARRKLQKKIIEYGISLIK